MRPQTERALANEDGFPAIQLGGNYGNTMTIRVGWNLGNIDRTQVIVIFFVIKNKMFEGFRSITYT